MAKPAEARACGLIGHAIGDSERSREPRCEKWMAGIGPVAWRMASEWDGAPGSSGAAVPRGKRTAAWQPGRRFYAKPAVPARTPGRIVQGDGPAGFSGGVAGWRKGGCKARCATPCHSCPPAPACGRRLLLYFASGGSAAGHPRWPALPNSGANWRAASWPLVSSRGPVTSACCWHARRMARPARRFRASVRRCQSAGASPPKALATLAGPSCCPLVRSKRGGGRPWRSPGDMSTRGWHGGPSRDLSAALSLPSFRKGTHSKRFE